MSNEHSDEVQIFVNTSRMQSRLRLVSQKDLELEAPVHAKRLSKAKESLKKIEPTGASNPLTNCKTSTERSTTRNWLNNKSSRLRINRLNKQRQD